MGVTGAALSAVAWNGGETRVASVRGFLYEPRARSCLASSQGCDALFVSLLLPLVILGTESVAAVSCATCVRPTAKCVVTKIEHVAGATQSADIDQITDWLRRWERVSQDYPALPLTRRDLLRHRVSLAVNAHAATAVEQLAGQVQVTQLRETFAWTIITRDARQVCLEATPQDETEQLFYGAVQVWLDVTSGALDELRVTDRLGQTRITCQHERTTQAFPIRLVSASDEDVGYLTVTSDDLPLPRSFK